MSDDVIVHVQDRIEIISIGIQGPQGPPGLSGSGFIHSQSSPAAEWIINHNLGFKPNVEVRNSGGQVGIAEVVHMSANQVRIYFAAATAGEARCI